jgi:hypothetical protein
MKILRAWFPRRRFARSDRRRDWAERVRRQVVQEERLIWNDLSSAKIFALFFVSPPNLTVHGADRAAVEATLFDG